MVSRLNDSLGRATRWTLFGCIAAASLAIAVSFTLAGAWPILAWSVVEVSVLAAAFVLVERRFDAWERLTVAGDRVVIDRMAHGHLERSEFNRCWLTVQLLRAEAPGAGGPRLMLRSAGREMHFGAALPIGQRVEVARALQRMVATR